jgi:hypothetical protein
MAARLRARVKIPRRTIGGFPDAARSQSFAPRSMSMRLRYDKGAFHQLWWDGSFWAAGARYCAAVISAMRPMNSRRFNRSNGIRCTQQPGLHTQYQIGTGQSARIAGHSTHRLPVRTSANGSFATGSFSTEFGCPHDVRSSTVGSRRADNPRWAASCRLGSRQ